MRRLPILVGAVVVLLILALSSVFIVDERKQALVLQFGQVKQIRTEPGLFFKLPLIQDVVYYDGRILPLDTQPLEVTPLDERRLVVDAFARWRITNPVEFRQAVGTEAAGEQRLEGILNASLRQVLGSVPSADVLSPERTVLMTRIRDEARSESQGLGVEIIDVRIRRADLPEQNLNATFERMNAEREREAADERARGKERAQEIRATADRQAVELVSDAERQAAIIRGQADAERSKIYADAFGQDPEFYAFYRSLEAYENALTGNNSTMVITPNSEFFEYLKTDRSTRAGSGGGAPAPTAALAAPATGSETAEGEAEAEPGSEAEVIVRPAPIEEVEPAPGQGAANAAGDAGQADIASEGEAPAETEAEVIVLPATTGAAEPADEGSEASATGSSGAASETVPAQPAPVTTEAEAETGLAQPVR